MLIDITLKITPKMIADAQKMENKSLAGHLGTHFDVMDKEFPLEYTKRRGIVFDVSHIRGRDIEETDIDFSRIEKDMFVAFCTDYISEVEYGLPEYFSSHPQLSHGLIEKLVEQGISIIALDCSGIRRAPEHIPKDRYCAEHDVFVVENLVNLKELLAHGDTFTAHTYPLNYADMTGLPCRVVAEV